MTIKVLSSLFLGIFVVSSHAAAFVEGGVASSDPATRFEPQVAIVCKSRNQYQAQYMSDSGQWVTNPASKVTCIKEKVDILQYCKQVYPQREITNIVESSKFFKVPNFCRVGHTKCKSSVFVKPYRCLEGSFQSDALLVPEGCLFDHIHNQSRCWEFDQWNTTADQACQARHLALKAFAMLLPCGIDLFSGVEFVCCPKNYKNHGKAHTMEVEEPVALPQVDRHVEVESKSPVSSPHSVTTTPSQELGTRDEYFSRFDPHEEHEAFRSAEQRLEERHREKVSKIMKEWSELEERYQDLHEEDPRGAEEFKHRMTQRFQQTVQAVESENEAEKRQLTALHQQRIVAHINEMKREAMTCYTKALAAAQQPNVPLQTHKVQKCLQKLLRALNKDRHHTVSHFKHLLNSDYEAADRERDSTLQHLADLDRMVNQSLNMLARKPDLYAKIGRLMHEYAATLRSKDTTPPELTPTPPREKEDIPNEEEDDDDDDDDDDEDEDDDEDYDEDEEDDDVDDDDDDDDDDEEDDDEDEEETKQEDHSPTATEEAESASSPSSPPSNSSSSSAEQRDSPSSPASDAGLPSAASAHQMEEPHVAHAQHNPFSHNQPSYSLTKDSESSAESRGVYFTLAFAGIALMGAMIVGIVVLRRRNSRHPHNQGFMEVDQAATPEERHVTNMQVNGYENPTYKYFEEK